MGTSSAFYRYRRRVDKEHEDEQMVLANKDVGERRIRLMLTRSKLSTAFATLPSNTITSGRSCSVRVPKPSPIPQIISLDLQCNSRIDTVTTSFFGKLRGTSPLIPA